MSKTRKGGNKKPDPSCHHGGDCSWCSDNRQINKLRGLLLDKDKKEYYNEKQGKLDRPKY